MNITQITESYPSKKVRVLYLDLDGTVRKGFEELGKFVNKPEGVEIFDGVKEKMKAYKNAGWRIVGITNQGGVATGQLSYEDMMQTVIRTNQLTGLTFDKVMACVHHPDAQEEEMKVCWCRKPRIGNVVLAAQQLGETYDECYPPSMSLFVGDRTEDEGCANNAGIPYMVAQKWRDTPIEELLIL